MADYPGLLVEPMTDEDYWLDSVMERVEEPDKYGPGGYHPIEIGDQLHNGRYRVIHRLGHGGSSTVWLALNQHYDNAAQQNAPRWRYVAVKIATADSKNDEAAILRRLQPGPQDRGCLSGLTADTKHDGYPFIVSLLDEFEITGPNGSHRCIVTELLGPSVAAVKTCLEIEKSWLLPVPLGRRFALQAAKAVALLHSRGIVHADLHLGNLAFALSVDMNSWTTEEVYAALGGEPVTVPFAAALSVAPAHPASSCSHHPKYLVCPPEVPWLFGLCDFSTSMIQVMDFTESFLLPFSGQAIPGTPMEFAAPELLLNLPADVTENIDIWALGCCICHLLGCSGFFVSLWDSLPLLLADVVGVLGGEKAIPERFRNAFSESGARARLDYKCRLDWDSRIKLMRGDPKKDDQVVVPLSTEDEKVLGKVLGNALVFEPANRATAAAIVAMMPAAWDTVESSCKDNGYEASHFVPTPLVLGNLEIWELAKPLECENQEDKEAMRHLA